MTVDQEVLDIALWVVTAERGRQISKHSKLYRVSAALLQLTEQLLAAQQAHKTADHDQEKTHG